MSLGNFGFWKYVGPIYRCLVPCGPGVAFWLLIFSQWAQDWSLSTLVTVLAIRTVTHFARSTSVASSYTNTLRFSFIWFSFFFAFFFNFLLVICFKSLFFISDDCDPNRYDARMKYTHMVCIVVMRQSFGNWCRTLSGEYEKNTMEWTKLEKRGFSF